MKGAALVLAAVGLLAGAALAARRVTILPGRTVTPRVGPHEPEARPPRPAAEGVPAETARAELRAEAPDGPEELNALQARLSRGLAEGDLTAEAILDRFRAETDPVVLDLLASVLASDPEAADQPGVLEAFLDLARSDALAARRQAAIAWLGSAWDRDGRVREALFGIARAEADAPLRLTALGTLQVYATKNHDQAAAVNAGLLDFARSESAGEMRAQALASLEMRSAGEEAVGPLAAFLADPSPEARRASADKLGEAPPEARRAAFAALERALEREADPVLRPALLYNLVRAGRAEAAEALRRAAGRHPELRPHAEDYLALLAREDLEWEHLAREKAELEFARAK
jgi:hypothetical protein